MITGDLTGSANSLGLWGGARITVWWWTTAFRTIRRTLRAAMSVGIWATQTRPTAAARMIGVSTAGCRVIRATEQGSTRDTTGPHAAHTALVALRTSRIGAIVSQPVHGN